MTCSSKSLACFYRVCRVNATWNAGLSVARLAMHAHVDGVIDINLSVFPIARLVRELIDKESVTFCG